MKIDLTRLINNFVESISFDDVIEIDNEHLKRTEIRRITPVIVKGVITKNSDYTYLLSIGISGTMVLPCSITLEDVDYPFNIEINEFLDENDENNEEYIKIFENSIDIFPIVWQNIVMEIPLKVVSPNANRRNISGIGWNLISEDDLNNDNKGGDTDGSSI